MSPLRLEAGMRALEFKEKRIILNRDAPCPEMGEGEVRIRVRLAGICGTDLELTRGYMGFEGIPGHEFVGVVTEDAGGDLAGRRVVSEINCACGACDVCRRGLPEHCPNRSVIGIDRRDGAFAEYIVVPRSNVHVLPDDIPDREGVLVEPFAAAMKGVDDAGLESGHTVAVLGDGSLGLMTATFAGTTGCPTTLIGKHPRKMDLLAGSGVRTLGLDRVSGGEIRSAFDRAIDCTGSPDGLALGLDLVRPRGRIVMKTTVSGTTEVALSSLVVDEVELVGSRCGNFSKAIEALGSGRISLPNLVTSVHDLEHWEDAFRDASSGESLKVLLRFDDTAA
jgi:threonine dehydrogenase-like Zn-dependent dehydrogenase